MIPSEKMSRLHIMGDRVLIKPAKEDGKTKSGLFLPPGYKEKEEIKSGYVIKTGPGYPIPSIGDDNDDAWKRGEKTQHYIPLQVQVGDFALFLQREAIELMYKEEKYFIVNQHNILFVERDETFFE